MLSALVRTITEILDSKRAAYSFIATVFAAILHLGFGVTPEGALILVSPLGLATAAEAHVDGRRGAATASAQSSAEIKAQISTSAGAASSQS